ncbi:diguanylate cyclase (GGDEF) domain-containing protein [Pseudomonas sp. NFACC23-1]|uniref:sensor domain-containing diguanylate cyclase n=1 Tax=unclassified Pseudomonas TaxID=196821 RepID=UPI00088E3D26|nr:MULTISPECIES: sensor domain-containing diguanylate cyclase [unclassified Pseudomonas]SDB62316.1 diguanylate cyclase (GGDEF) domain-containing protein [Pseudomonas sp. NFACC17-2]SEJ89037.1 diguanylate cyclase (GGDEF) domain-containing protein [Pseudomonas sp. NFACC23-1]SFW92274.1 diguanylate cyclase (GGDEF) domain-containing protein [Pseudomonas sp. NFACC16-2]
MSARSATPGNTPSSIRSERVLVLASSLVVIAILSIVTFLLIREHAAAQQAATRAATNIVQLIDADVLRNAELYDLSLQGLVTAAKREDLKDVSPAIRHLALFDRATAAPYKGDILLLDKRGDVIADSASITPRIGNYADREYFQSHIQDPNPGMMISRPFRSRSHGQEWRISFSYRVSDERGEFMGVAEAAMRLSYFNQLFKSLNIGHGGTVNLISRDGVLLAQEPPLADNMIGKDFSNRPNFVRILREGNGSFAGISSVDQTQRLYTFSQVGNLPLIVVVALSSQEVFASWQRTALLVSCATGALCIGLLWLTWLLRRELRRRYRAERELAQLASIDALTGLANRRTLDETLQQEWLRAQRSGQPLSVLMIDADHFKTFNDRHGHQRGDEALRTLAHLISRHVRRPADLAARYGGEEFSVVLPETTTAGAFTMAQNIREAVEQLLPVADGEAPMTVSIGIATWVNGPYGELQQLLFAADKALYQAKASGRNRVVCAM